MILPVESGRLLGLSFYRNSHKGLDMSPSNISSHATEPPVTSVWDGRALSDTTSLCDEGCAALSTCSLLTSSLRRQHRIKWVENWRETEVTSTIDLGWFGYGSDLTNWEAMNNATGCYRGNATTWHYNHLLLNFHAPPESQPNGGTLTAQLDSSPGAEPTAVEPHQTHLSHPIRSHQIPASFVLIWSSRL